MDDKNAMASTEGRNVFNSSSVDKIGDVGLLFRQLNSIVRGAVNDHGRTHHFNIPRERVKARNVAILLIGSDNVFSASREFFPELFS